MRRSAEAVAAMQASLRRATRSPGLPRSKMVDGRFVIDKEHFPGYVDFILGEGGGFKTFMKWRRGMRGNTAPVPSAELLDRALPVRKVDAAALADPPQDKVQATWLGHASVLLQWEGWSVLADPIFSERCSPVQWAGPRRVRPSPIKTAELPAVDAVLISHSHYDHLDLTTVRGLAASQPDALFCVPLGMKSWFAKNVPSAHVVEFDWGDELALEEEGRPRLTLASIPCQHWCKRTMSDTNTVLWCSWMAFTPSLTYFFGGDTGYCGEIFRKAGELYGPVDVSAIPIGAYGVPAERWFHSPNHMNAAEAVECHLDLRSRRSFGVHWGTFLLTGEHVLEPPSRLAEAVAAKGLPEDSFVVFDHGETRAWPLDRPTTPTCAECED